MCKYCEGPNEDRLTLQDEDFEEVKLKIWSYYFLDKVTLSDAFTGDDSIPINYCPMCGRKLNEE